MNVVKVGSSNTGLPSGRYQTMLFVPALYQHSSTTPKANVTAQLCRQCQGGNLPRFLANYSESHLASSDGRLRVKG